MRVGRIASLDFRVFIRAHRPLFRQALLGAIIALLSITASAFPAYASAPRIIIVHSEPAMTPAFLRDWNDNLTLVRSEPIEVIPEELDQRPYVHLALFFGPEWNAYIDRGEAVEDLGPEQASEHGRFYPMAGGAPPLIIIEDSVDVVTNEGLRVLADAGVPVRVEVPPSAVRQGGDQALPSQMPALAAAGIGGMVLGVYLLVRRRSARRVSPT
ncbi:MAG: hypothetical protein GEU73_10620 [Chloroflexi bacterium]|nr:hypothetical protein [Chloroflexota bacterium]